MCQARQDFFDCSLVTSDGKHCLKQINSSRPNNDDDVDADAIKSVPFNYSLTQIKIEKSKFDNIY